MPLVFHINIYYYFWDLIKYLKRHSWKQLTIIKMKSSLAAGSQLCATQSLNWLLQHITFQYLLFQCEPSPAELLQTVMNVACGDFSASSRCVKTFVHILCIFINCYLPALPFPAACFSPPCLCLWLSLTSINATDLRVRGGTTSLMQIMHFVIKCL